MSDVMTVMPLNTAQCVRIPNTLNVTVSLFQNTRRTQPTSAWVAGHLTLRHSPLLSCSLNSSWFLLNTANILLCLLLTIYCNLLLLLARQK